MRIKTKPPFQAGGDLNLDKGMIYIERPADEELLLALLDGELCYVLATRQIGKSSLRKRTAQRLQNRGFRCLTIDLLGIGTHNTTAEQWYFDLVATISDQCELPGSVVSGFWRTNEQMSPARRWLQFLRQQILTAEAQAIVLFIDEIQMTRALPDSLRNEFFGCLRHVYNQATDDPVWRQLRVCLLGVARPAELIADAMLTPFNVGRGIRLEDISRTQMEPFRQGMNLPEGSANAILDAIYDWTDGHLYMIQKICLYLYDKEEISLDDIDAAVVELFLSRGINNESNLYSAAGYVNECDGTMNEQMLRLYGRLLSGESVAAQCEDPVQLGLRLAGMAADRRAGSQMVLRIRNRIFAKVFDRRWLRAQEPQRFMTASLAQWLRSGKDDGYLLRGDAMSRALEWEKGRADLTADEQAFLRASEVRAMQEQATREEHKHAMELAQKRRKKLSHLGLLTSALLIALIWGWNQQHKLRQTTLALNNQQALLFAARPKTLPALKLAVDAVKTGRLLGQDPAPEVADALVAASMTAVKFQRNLFSNSIRVSHAVFSPDGKHVAVLLDDNQVGIIDENTERFIWKWKSPFGEMARLVFSSDGAQLLAVSSGDSVIIWDVQSGIQKLGPLKLKDNVLLSASFTTMGPRAVTLNRHGEALIWDLQDREKLICQIKLSDGHLHSAALSPDGKYMITGATNGKVQMWNISSGMLMDDLYAHAGFVSSVAVSPDSTHVASIGKDGTVHVWDINRHLLMTKRTTDTLVWSVVFSPDNQFLASNGPGRVVRVWQLQDDKEVSILEGYLSASISADNERVLAVREDGVARIWNIRQGRVFKSFKGHQGPIYNTAAFLSDENRVVALGDGRTIDAWDAETGTAHMGSSLAPPSISVATLSRNGRHAVTGDKEGPVRLWDVRSGRQEKVLMGHKSAVSALAITTDGQRIAAAAEHDPRIIVWDASSGTRQSELAGPPGHEITQAQTTSLAFSPSADLLAAGTKDGRIQIWQLSSGRLTQNLRAQDAPVRNVAFAPDGTRLLSDGPGGSVQLWEVRTGTRIRSLGRPESQIIAAAFSPDGRRIVTGAEDGQVHVWDADQGSVWWAAKLGKRPLRTVTYSPNGEHLVLADEDHLVWLTPSTLQGILQYAQQVLQQDAELSSTSNSASDILEAIDIDAACKWALGDPAAYAIWLQQQRSPGAAYAWQCQTAGGSSCISLTEYCQSRLKEPRVAANPLDPDDALSWRCMRSR